MPTIPITKFNTSMGVDFRSSPRLVKNFDNFTEKHVLAPYKDSEDAGLGATQNSVQLQNFLMYGGSMYALGRQIATAKALIYKNTGIDVPSWSTPSNGQDNTYTISNYDVFVEYKGILWGTNSQGLWSYNIGSTTFTEAAQALSFTTGITQGLVHSKDSILYLAYSNATAAYVASKNGAGAWSTTALTIPTLTHKPVSLCEYGNYLAILFAPINPGLNSFVLLWDRDSSVNTLADTIDVGNKEAKIIENLDGYLVVISTVTPLNSTAPTKVVFSKYGGGGFQVFNELHTMYGSVVRLAKQKYNNRLYFILSNAGSYGQSTTDYCGVWSVGKNTEFDQFSVNFDRPAKNDTTVYSVLGFIVNQDYFYISYLVTNGGSDYELYKTNDQASYDITSKFRTSINPDMPDGDKIKNKALVSAGLTYEQLPSITSTPQCILKYSVDGGALTPIFTETSATARFTKFPIQDEGYDIDFQIESKGMRVTGFFYEYLTKTT